MNIIVENLCDGFAAASAAAIATTSATPEGALVMSFVAPVAGGFFKTVVNSLEHLISSRGKQRIDVMAQVAYDTIQYNLSNGLEYRKDNLFIRDENNQCKFDDILEGIIRSVSSNSDQMKSAIYGRFLGNIPFHSEYRINMLYNMKDTIQDLTYFELCVLSLYYHRIYLGTMEINRYINDHPETIAGDIFIALKKLSSNSCIMNIIPSKMSAEVINYKISKYGKDLCILTQLNEADVVYPDFADELAMINKCLIDICHLADNDPLYDNAREKLRLGEL